MDIKLIFDSHFEQCSKVIADFEINGIPYRGKWSKNQSMPLFYKDLVEAVEHENSQNEINNSVLSDQIAKLESQLRDALAKGDA